MPVGNAPCRVIVGNLVIQTAIPTSRLCHGVDKPNRQNDLDDSRFQFPRLEHADPDRGE